MQKITKTVSVKKISAASVAENFVNELVFNDGPSKDLRAHNGECLTDTFFKRIYKSLGVRSSFQEHIISKGISKHKDLTEPIKQ